MIASVGPAVAWDYEGHRIVNQIALSSLPTNFPSFVFTPVAWEQIAGETQLTCPCNTSTDPISTLILRHCSLFRSNSNWSSRSADWTRTGSFPVKEENGMKGVEFIRGQIFKAGQKLGDFWGSAYRQAGPDSYLKARLIERKYGKGGKPPAGQP